MPHLWHIAGHIAFRRDVTSVCAYGRTCVWHVRSQSLANIFKFSFKFTFTSSFLLEVITWVLLTLRSWSLVSYLPDLNLQLYARTVPRSCSVVGIGIEMYNRSDWVFGKRLLKFMRPDIFAIWAKSKWWWHLCILDTCLVFKSHIRPLFLAQSLNMEIVSKGHRLAPVS